MCALGDEEGHATADGVRGGRLFFFQAEDGIRDHCVTGVQDVCSSDLGAATVEFHGSPFYGDEQRVVYKYPNIPQSSAWMSIEEFTDPGGTSVFNQKALTNYNSSSQLQDRKSVV